MCLVAQPEPSENQPQALADQAQLPPAGSHSAAQTAALHAKAKPWCQAAGHEGNTNALTHDPLNSQATTTSQPVWLLRSGPGGRVREKESWQVPGQKPGTEPRAAGPATWEKTSKGCVPAGVQAGEEQRASKEKERGKEKSMQRTQEGKGQKNGGGRQPEKASYRN